MRKLELNEEERETCFSVLCDDNIWKNKRSLQDKLIKMLYWEAWKSEAKSFEEQPPFEFYEEKENDVE